MDLLFPLSSQMDMWLPGCSKMASEADLDHCAHKCRHKASKPWAQLTGWQWGPPQLP